MRFEIDSREPTPDFIGPRIPPCILSLDREVEAKMAKNHVRPRLHGRTGF